jgi:hypothetical protein
VFPKGVVRILSCPVCDVQFYGRTYKEAQGYKTDHYREVKAGIQKCVPPGKRT